MYYLLGERPFVLRTRHIQEVVNECFVMMCLYHLLTFTSFVEDVSASQLYMGRSYIVIIFTLIAFNLSFLLKNIASRSIHHYKLRQLRKESI